MRDSRFARSNAPCSNLGSKHAFKGVVPFNEVVNQGHANMTNDQNGQNPRNWRMKLPQGFRPSNLLTLGKNLDPKRLNAIATTQHDHNFGYRHQQQAKIQRPMTGLDQHSLRRVRLRTVMALASGPSQA